MADKVNSLKYAERDYNFIYDKLVRDSNDFTGMVAYGLYKQEKIKYFNELRCKNSKITDQDVANFHIASSVRIDAYKKEAVDYITGFVNDMIDVKVKMSRDMITEIVEEKTNAKNAVNQTVDSLFNK